MNVLNQIIHNRPLITSIAAWAVAQAIKVILVVIINKKLDFSRMVGSGGMPSSHSAFVVSLAVSIGMNYGFDSALFAICACFALVVMYDASGVRRSAGQQARVLNQIVDHWGRGDFVDTDKRLKELLGHTPMEVVAGAILGVITALLMNGYI